VPFEERPVFPEEAVELRGVVRSEPAPEDELLRRGDGRDRVELEEAEVTDGVDDVGRQAVEELRPDRDPACLLERDDHRATCSKAAVPRSCSTEVVRTSRNLAAATRLG